MDTSILEMLGKIAGLGGLALGVFLILFRDILKKLKVPVITREQWYRVIVYFMILVWSIAIVGLGTWLYSYAQDKQHSSEGYVSNRPPILWSLEPNKNSPQLLPVTVQWTANATDPEGDPISYSFWMQSPPGTGEVQEFQEWSTMNSAQWMPKKAGTYRIITRIKDGNHPSGVEYDDSRSEYFTVQSTSEYTYIKTISPEENFNRIMQLAWAARDTENWSESLARYEQALTILPNDVDALIGKSLVLSELGRHEETIATCQKLLAIDPNNTTAQNNLAMALYFMGKHEEASEVFDKLLAHDPSIAGYWYNQCQVLNAAARYKEAVRSCDKAIELEPTEKLAWNLRGSILFSLGKYEEALTNHRKASELDPQWSTAVFNMGTCYFKLGRPKEALDMFNAAVELDPTYIPALNAKRWTEESLKKNQTP
jgi:tetratricopeptide (TPR) repeat protein